MTEKINKLIEKQLAQKDKELFQKIIDSRKVTPEFVFIANYDAGDYTQAMRCIKSLSTVDVVERKKVDEAIEELRKEIEENHLNVIDYADGRVDCQRFYLWCY